MVDSSTKESAQDEVIQQRHTKDDVYDEYESIFKEVFTEKVIADQVIEVVDVSQKQ